MDVGLCGVEEVAFEPDGEDGVGEDGATVVDVDDFFFLQGFLYHAHIG